MLSDHDIQMLILDGLTRENPCRISAAVLPFKIHDHPTNMSSVYPEQHKLEIWCTQNGIKFEYDLARGNIILTRAG
jgi:hypothetical protein